MSDMDHAEWLNGPEPPECVECGDPTTRTNDAGIPIHADCEDIRNERLYQQSLDHYYGGSSPQTVDEQMADAYQTERSGR